MKLIEQSCLNILGFLVTLENFVVVLAAIRTKSLLENTHYNLVISLSVCDFILRNRRHPVWKCDCAE